MKAIRAVLSMAIRHGGTTLRDYVGAGGEPGYFRQKLYVYERAGEPCRKCGEPVKHRVQGQRATYWCGTASAEAACSDMKEHCRRISLQTTPCLPGLFRLSDLHSICPAPRWVGVRGLCALHRQPADLGRRGADHPGTADGEVRRAVSHAAELAATPAQELRAVGFSGSKVAALHDLAAHYVDGRLPADADTCRAG